MATVTIEMVKELRDKTGAGMMDCKTALTENNADMEASVDWLRKKGLAKAAKKSGRIAADGLIGVASDAASGAVIEVNSETDFVARNEKFQELVTEIARLALKVGGDFDKLAASMFTGAKLSVADHIKETVATIGENLSLRRSAGLNVKKGVVASYVHSAYASGLGKIGVIVALESEADTEKLSAFGRQLAMHIAAANPIAVDVGDLDQTVVARERAVYLEQAQQSGKSADVIEKMVEGRLRKEFMQQVVLLQQVFVIDGKETVANIVKAKEKELGKPIRIGGFVRYALGEGIEKKEEDFAAEVAAAVKGS